MIPGRLQGALKILKLPRTVEGVPPEGHILENRKIGIPAGVGMLQKTPTLRA